MRVKLSWGAKASVVAGGMVLSLLFVPVTTSLGQGIHENILVGWEGRYDQFSHQYYCRFLMSGGTSLDVRAAGFSPRLLVHRGHGEFWTTALDPLPVIEAAQRTNPTAVEEDLGTRANVADPLSPFPGRPVAYSAAFLQALSKMEWNPEAVGGPNIPPHRVPVNRLTNGVLQIDTRPDNNTLKQLMPGQTPLSLRALWHPAH